MTRNAHDESKGEKLAFRISQILALLHQGEALGKKQMAEQFGVQVRTIERDLQRLAQLVERNADGKWVLRSSAKGTVKSVLLKDYAQLVGTDQLFPDSSLQFLIEQAEHASAKRSKGTTQVTLPAQVDLKARKQEFEQLDQACMKRRVCGFRYRDKARLVHPYQLRHVNGVWYLAGEEGKQLKIFSLERISELVVHEQTFRPKQAHLDYISSQDDVWFTGQTTDVILRVAPEVTHYFERRKLLQGQSNDPRSADGSMVVRARVNHMQQLLPVVRYWLPHVRIIEPKAWHAELVAGLKGALEKWGEA